MPLARALGERVERGARETAEHFAAPQVRLCHHPHRGSVT
jgi:hypothetical protein